MDALRPILLAAIGAVLAVFTVTASAQAQNREVPYWASLRYDEVRMRVGPSQEYKIDWIYRRKGMPVKVVRTRDGWRLVEDPKGGRGWIASSQLVLTRGVLVTGDGLVDIRAEPDAGSMLRWKAEAGVVAKLLDCSANWCEIDASGRIGWVPADRIWGEGEP
ncbi:SH3 domain-containing protein [Erythrobacter sp. F6033]|uniref:SH3 domain-containing protein n=1 Tax=Erythrobacter sp. F6033 TaxID=2926401 RepID=UPI001FF5259B|nr:SH3 domain-containing protein [Erythrobacter sp. F6033]MCK0128272.1 SH3 domain-containing protein [Erythrobacter sp. F6033]